MAHETFSEDIDEFGACASPTSNLSSWTPANTACYTSCSVSNSYKNVNIIGSNGRVQSKIMVTFQMMQGRLVEPTNYMFVELDLIRWHYASLAERIQGQPCGGYCPSSLPRSSPST